MASVCSPTSLQQACEVAAASWLVQWSGLVGQVTARASAPQRHTHQRREPLATRKVQGGAKHRLATTTSNSGCKCKAAAKSHGLDRVPKGTSGRSKATRIVPTLQYEELQSHRETLASGAATPRNDAQTFVDGILVVNSLPPRCETVGVPTLAKLTTSTDFCKDVYNAVVQENVTKCSQFFKTQLPPILINQILSTAWRLVSQHVTLGGRFEAVPEYQVVDWTRQAPVLLKVAGSLTHRSFPLDLSGVPESFLDATIAEINEKFPRDHINKLVLPRTKFKSTKSVVPKCQGTLLEFVKRTNLSSLTLHSELCDNKALGLISKLSLQELDIGGSSVTEEGLLSKFCGVPFRDGNKAVEAIRDCKFQYSSTHLSKHLRKFSMSFHNISSSVYHLILILFPELQFYNPHRDIKPSIRESTRFVVPLENDQICTVNRTLRLLKIMLGRASRSEILEVSRICPSAREISLDVELNPEETLDALESFEGLSDLTLAYYPSFASSPPKLNGSVLLPLLSKCKNRIQSLNLTGFNISDICLHELSQLPELKSLSMGDCWLANPKYVCQDPFSSLENLTLQFLPPNSTLQFLTSGKMLHSLNLDFVASEWEGSALSDTHVKQLVTSGRISTIQSFMAASPYLTQASVRSLTLLPTLRNIGHLARWGLTDEELHCINHSGPPHLICMQ